MRVGAVGVLVGSAPFVPSRGQFIRGERAGSGGERARQHDALLAVPRLVRLQGLGVGADVLRGQLRGFVGLGVEPAEGFEVLQVVVLGERRREVDLGVVPPLRGHHDAPNLLNLGVIGR